MSRIIMRAAPLLAALLLASCGGSGGGGGSSSVVVPPASQPRAEDAFGSVFASAFRADPFGTPVTPVDGDIIPLSLTNDSTPVG